MKILIAEDDEALCALLEFALEKRGYTVESAPNGRAALEKAAAAPPDLIISDIMMPEMDGFMFCRKVKSDPRLKSIHFILYTATKCEMDEKELARKLGASRLIVKTGGLEPLLEAVMEEVEAIKAAARPQVSAAFAGKAVDAEYIRVLSRKLLVKEGELKQERDQAKMYLDIAGVMIVALDRDGRVAMINKKGSAVLGYGEDELAGKNWFDTCLPPEIREDARGVYKKLMAGELAPVEYNENPVLAKSGERRMIAFHSSVIRGASAAITGILFSGSDITDQRRAEEALFQAQKMDSIGQLSAGIAHDLNNLLGPVMAYADFLRESTPAGDARRDDIDGISRAAGLAASLVRQLLAFSRRQVLEPKVLDLNGIVKGLGCMLQRIIGEHIRIVYSLDPSAGLVKVDPVQMDQVIINLAVNARDAMERGGTLTIATGPADLERSGERLAGRYFVLTVTDTGCGMDAATLGRVFEPFFTTKKLGHGTGLGLSTVYGIVKQSGGEIRVESRPGEGSVFRIYLPFAEGAAEAPAEASGDVRPAAAGKGAVLLAEDDETMRRVAKRMLNSAGYQVIEAVDGREALMLLEKNPQAISILLTDMAMPELDGVGLAREVLTRYPHIRILCMSGYADNRDELERVLGANVGYIPKPFAPDALLKKLEDLAK
ncbi:MAG: response regulator [Elusimicrobiota bacterium]|nr:response regulator [Elusimicrobiota bacterium]